MIRERKGNLGVNEVNMMLGMLMLEMKSERYSNSLSLVNDLMQNPYVVGQRNPTFMALKGKAY